MEKPDLPEQLLFAWTAFNELKTDRQWGFSGPGPIPFAAVERYAARYGLAELDEFERLVGRIRVLDGEYLAATYRRLNASGQDRSGASTPH